MPEVVPGPRTQLRGITTVCSPGCTSTHSREPVQTQPSLPCSTLNSASGFGRSGEDPTNFYSGSSADLTGLTLGLGVKSGCPIAIK